MSLRASVPPFLLFQRQVMKARGRLVVAVDGAQQPNKGPTSLEDEK